ncbi:hypothetical protein DSL64_07805 [Dyadobacter luteus]|uniref:Uncharacterized protein n=1 Tax=Dyadobacter luteus TaxID=2259619 RepID=A0A3D8YE33_9BACT|nr:hypothetical protein DSL64_07805 [Dyadobacter luteus]
MPGTISNLKKQSDLREFVMVTARYLVYGCLIVLLAQLIKWDASQAEGDLKFSEQSYTEACQLVLLLFSSLLLWHIYRQSKAYGYVALLMMGLTATSLVREMDDPFDALFDGAWQITAFSVAAWVIFTVYKNRHTFLSQFFRFVSTPSFGMFLSGIFTTYIFSRLIGRKVFWQAVMEEQYFRAVKNASEESTELYGYLLIFIAVLELTYYHYRSKAQNQSGLSTDLADELQGKKLQNFSV